MFIYFWSTFLSKYTEVLNENIALAAQQKHPHLNSVDLIKNVSYNGFDYRNGMVVAHGSLSGIHELSDPSCPLLCWWSSLYLAEEVRTYNFQHNCFCCAVGIWMNHCFVFAVWPDRHYFIFFYFVDATWPVSLKRYMMDIFHLKPSESLQSTLLDHCSFPVVLR